MLLPMVVVLLYGTSPDDIMQGGYVGYSGTGPISVNFDTMGQGLTPAQIEAFKKKLMAISRSQLSKTTEKKTW